MTAIELVNLALHKIGVSQGVAALDDQTREAYTAGQQYDHLLRLTLREFNWPFATAYANLVLVAGPAWTLAAAPAWNATTIYQAGDVVQQDGAVYYALSTSLDARPPGPAWSSTPQLVAGGDWRYAYRQPEDCIRLRRLVDEATGRKWNRHPIPFRVGRDRNGLLVYTNRAEAVLEYTTLDCSNLWADDLFLAAFTWRLAAAFAPTLSRNKLTADDCMKYHYGLLRQAAAVAMDEQELEHPGDAEVIEYRNAA